jgi:hypothetical protein
MELNQEVRRKGSLKEPRNQILGTVIEIGQGVRAGKVRVQWSGSHVYNSDKYTYSVTNQVSRKTWVNIEALTTDTAIKEMK